MKQYIRRNWKTILNIATIVALVVLVYAIRHQLVDSFKNLGRIHAWALLLVFPLQWLNYHAQTKMYQDLFAIVGNKLRYGFLFKASLELNFVNHVFPSGGVSGISYFGARLKNSQITGGKATLVQLMKLVLYLVSFEFLLIIGLLAMAVGNRVNDVVIMVTTLVATLLVLLTLAFVAIIGSERRIKVTFMYISQQLNKLIHLVRPKHPETINTVRVESAVLDLHTNYKMIESRYKDLKWTLAWAFIANLTEVLTIYAVYVAFGEFVNIGAVILAYAVANFAGLVSVMPGGVGVYEALMTAVLVAAGVPAGLSLSVTVMYRIISTLVQVPPGYYYYHRNLTQRRDDADKVKEMHAD